MLNARRFRRMSHNATVEQHRKSNASRLTQPDKRFEPRRTRFCFIGLPSHSRHLLYMMPGWTTWNARFKMATATRHIGGFTSKHEATNYRAKQAPQRTTA